MATQTAPTQTINVHFGYLRAKRVLDILFVLLGSLFILVIGVFIAVLILLGSRGPILYRQKRIGQNGVEFEMLKFRSMYVNNNDTPHREAIKQYMNGEILNDNGDMLYKIGNDPRITRVGRIIR